MNGLSRREFLRTGLAAGALMSLGSRAASPPKAEQARAAAR
ncbi:MAG: twin-arginine translocation signal domain-containing protein, partial [Sedimentisphaerales bacterium]|nr:twin-arginine translocation signal domain-containing protein [Sedimentisphaerales bacterium]